MSNRKLFLVLTIFALTAVRAAAQEVFLVDKVVATVGRSYILYSELIAAADQLGQRNREQGIAPQNDLQTEALQQLVMQKMLYNQAIIDSLEVNIAGVLAETQAAVDNEVAALGSIAAVEQKYGKSLYIIQNDIQKQQEEMRYIQAMNQKIREDVKISAREVERYYRDIPKDSLPLIPEQYSFSQIVMLPASKEVAELRARQRLLGFKERILNGEKFETLAILYSEDNLSAQRGGEMDPMSKDNFVGPFGDALVRLKPGQISEVVQTQFGFHIIQLIEKQGNLYRCRHILIRPSYTSEEKAEVNKRLDSLAASIRSGNITFADAAARYSDDKYSKNNGGKATNIELLARYGDTDPKSAQIYFFREELLPAEQAQLRTLKIGDISNAFNTTDMYENGISKIVRLDEILPVHEAKLGEDYAIVEGMALAEKQNEEFLKWLDKTAATMYIRIDPRYRDLDFTYDFMKR